MAGTKYIQNIELGEVITDFFVVRWLELRHYDGKPFISMELGCSRGRIRATYWGEDSTEIARELDENDVVKIQAHGSDFKGQRCLKIERIRKANPDEVSYEKLLPKGKYSPKVLWNRLKKIITSLEDGALSELLHFIFESDREFSKKFATYPAAKLWHGAYVGGLIEHTLRVAKLCDVASTFYKNCRRDVLIAGALLHDIGKVDEISTRGFFNYSTRGRLIGHIALGLIRVNDAILQQSGFPSKLADEIFHLLLSHHGTNEMGSPVPPKTLEATILHHADMLDAQSEGVQHIIERDLPKNTEFSEYIKILGRFIYLSGYRSDD